MQMAESLAPGYFLTSAAPMHTHRVYLVREGSPTNRWCGRRRCISTRESGENFWGVGKNLCLVSKKILKICYRIKFGGRDYAEN